MKYLLSFLLLLLTQASPVDLSGVWVLDKGASESMDALLKAEGVGALERKVYSHLGVTLTIKQTDSLVTINMRTSVLSELEELKTDGTPQDREVYHVGKVKCRTTWTDGGQALQTVTDLKAGDGTPALATVHRSLEDKDTLAQRLTLVLQDGTTIRVKRIYRRRTE